jgi:hypothetical protein
MSRITTVTLCGSVLYTEEMLTIGNRYNAMGCFVLFPLQSEEEEKDNVSSIDQLDELSIRRVEMCDILHVVHWTNIDTRSQFEHDYAVRLKKTIVYAVPRISYINTYALKPDNYVYGPLALVDRTTEAYVFRDLHGKQVFVINEKKELVH